MKALLAAAALLLSAPAWAADNAVMAADRAFSRMSAEKGVAYAFWFYSARSARLYGRHGGPHIGRAATAPAQVHDSKDVLTWAPTAGAVGGNLGWTDGVWTHVTPSGTTTGHYVTVWVKEDGQWKMQADIGNQDE